MELVLPGLMQGLGYRRGQYLDRCYFYYINDMPNTVSNARIAMFADESECYMIIGQESDIVNLQQDLDALFAWSLAMKCIFNLPNVKMCAYQENV